MKLKFLFCLLIIQTALLNIASAQTNEQSYWGAWFHTQRISKHWGASFDGQVRSAHHARYAKHILLRPSANYYFDKNKNAALGYAYIATNGRSGETKTFRPESRIFEQFIVTHKAGLNTQVTHRFRLEQRFLGQTATQHDYFSQRFRYFVRGVVPLNRDSVFTRGTFLALQNETFANVQNKAKVNKHTFDQNRAYIAFGYRLNKMIDVEAGYLNQYIKQAEAYTINHVAQFALYTRF
ncbi:DUF2490 domain-containing protein [Mucilaginibacter xinganensis]|uniref:DUF2490 domain-containing protein n=1 Tax=Mucilaginibacter xinganensis TaxID=1234841 RepID=A0A223NRA5_9SPHI|nr:DUF2490 domain-containing protein [Mucilaginibacter xinganensis]ASU32326.1 hypothetical protein MuYL_0423 [Mucilaginibacter xinganensis]